MWGDMSLWNVQGPLLHSGDHIVPRILTVDYTFNIIKHQFLNMLKIKRDINQQNFKIIDFYFVKSELFLKLQVGENCHSIM